MEIQGGKDGIILRRDALMQGNMVSEILGADSLLGPFDRKARMISTE